MKKLAFLIAAIAALSWASTAAADTVAVSITPTGFKPSAVTLRPGDTITWQNADRASHQIVSDTGVFKSPLLKTGESYSFLFETSSSYSYHDGLNPSQTGMSGEIHVRLNAVTIGITRIRSIYGNPIRVFGSVPNGESGQEVTIHATPYGGATTTRTVVTNGGAYELTFNPKVRTEFYATWNGTRSDTAPFIGVRPLVVFKTLSPQRNTFMVRVRAAKSYAHKVVRIQRLNAKGAWVTTKTVRLNRNGIARFTGRFARGLTRARAWVAPNPGYEMGFSVTKTVRR